MPVGVQDHCKANTAQAQQQQPSSRRHTMVSARAHPTGLLCSRHISILT
jgi:hypothetical protein